MDFCDALYARGELQETYQSWDARRAKSHATIHKHWPIIIYLRYPVAEAQSVDRLLAYQIRPENRGCIVLVSKISYAARNWGVVGLTLSMHIHNHCLFVLSTSCFISLQNAVPIQSHVFSQPMEVEKRFNERNSNKSEGRRYFQYQFLRHRAMSLSKLSSKMCYVSSSTIFREMACTEHRHGFYASLLLVS